MHLFSEFLRDWPVPQTPGGLLGTPVNEHSRFVMDCNNGLRADRSRYG